MFLAKGFCSSVFFCEPKRWGHCSRYLGFFWVPWFWAGTKLGTFSCKSEAEAKRLRISGLPSTRCSPTSAPPVESNGNSWRHAQATCLQQSGVWGREAAAAAQTRLIVIGAAWVSIEQRHPKTAGGSSNLGVRFRHLNLQLPCSF
jgi:hypothetical protein